MNSNVTPLLETNGIFLDPNIGIKEECLTTAQTPRHHIKEMVLDEVIALININNVHP